MMYKIYNFESETSDHTFYDVLTKKVYIRTYKREGLLETFFEHSKYYINTNVEVTLNNLNI